MVFKVLTKVLVHCILPLLDDIISPLHSSFIPRNVAADNIIITQELIHTIKNTKWRVKDMAVKLDIDKAYDRVN